MTEPFFIPKMKWTRNRYGEHFAFRDDGMQYLIRRQDIGRSEGGLMWLVYKCFPGQPERLLRPATKTLKKAQERAEIDRYWDEKEEKES